MIKAIVFDFNGVIADTDKFDIKAIEYACRKKDLEFSSGAFNDFFSGKTLRDGFESFLKTQGREQEINEFITLKKNFDSHYPEYIVPYDDALKLIKLVDGDFSLGLATGARRNLISLALKILNLQGIFQIILAAEDYEKGKPDPTVYSLAIQALRLPSQDVLVIDDHPLGIEAAKRAGIRCLAVAHTHPISQLQGADYVTQRLDSDEVLSLLNIERDG